MNNKTKTKISLDKNIIYVIVFTVLIIIAIVLLLTNNSKDTDTPVATGADAQPTMNLAVVSSYGDASATVDSKINIRKIKMSDSAEDIQKYEKKQSDTSKTPTISESKDGYTHYLYDFVDGSSPTFFGVSALTSSSTQDGSISAKPGINYIFFGDSLNNIYVNMGGISVEQYNKMISNATAKYGSPTQYKSYNIGTQINYWRNDTVILEIQYDTDNTAIRITKR